MSSAGRWLVEVGLKISRVSPGMRSWPAEVSVNLKMTWYWL